MEIALTDVHSSELVLLSSKEQRPENTSTQCFLELSGSISCIAAIPDHQCIVAGANKIISGYQEQNIRLSDGGVNHSEAAFKNILAVHDVSHKRPGACMGSIEHRGSILGVIPIRKMAFNWSNFATCGNSGAVSIYSTEIFGEFGSANMKLEDSFQVAEEGMDALTALEVRESKIITVTEGGYVYILDIERGVVLQKMTSKGKFPLAAIAVQGGGYQSDRFVTAGSSPIGQLQFWDVRMKNNRSILSFKNTNETVPYHCVTQNEFTPECFTAGSASGFVDTWDIRVEGKINQHQKLHTSGVSSIIAHPLRPSMISAGADGNLLCTKAWLKNSDSRDRQPLSMSQTLVGGYASACFDRGLDQVCAVTKHGFLVIESQLEKRLT